MTEPQLPEPNDARLYDEQCQSTWKYGDTLVKRRHHGSDYVEQVLNYLAKHGYAYSPQHLGQHSGHDYFKYIQGATGTTSVVTDTALKTIGCMLRQLHDITAGTELAVGGDCVIHGDPSPDNTVFDNEQPIALIDWDYAMPGNRLDDVAYVVWRWCLDTSQSFDDKMMSIIAVIDGYEGDEPTHITPEQLLNAIKHRQKEFVNDAYAWKQTADSTAKEVYLWANTAQQWILTHESACLTALRALRRE